MLRYFAKSRRRWILIASRGQRPVALSTRDGNSGTGTRYLSGGMGTRVIFYPWVAEQVFFPSMNNSTGIRYFTTAIILCCEQVKMCSFCYINYDLFWLLNFATLLSQIFVEY
jgi:hypothetical protein